MKTLIHLIISVSIILALAMFMVPDKFKEIPVLKDVALKISAMKEQALKEEPKEEQKEEVSQEESEGKIEEKEISEKSLDKEKLQEKEDGQVLQSKLLDLNGDGQEDKALLVKSEDGIKLEALVSDEKVLDQEISDNAKKMLLVKESFEKGDTLVLIKRHEEGRDKLKMLLRNGKMILGGFNHKSKDMSCDINFLNKRAFIDGVEVKHKEKIMKAELADENSLLALCVSLKDLAPEKPVQAESSKEESSLKIEESAPAPASSEQPESK
jgi:hypothetical protein